MAAALFIAIVSVIMAIYYPATMPPFSTSLAFLLICATAGTIIVIADNQRPPDDLVNVFNPPGLFRYSTRLYGRKDDRVFMMFNSTTGKDEPAPENGLRLAKNTSMFKLVTSESELLWHPGYFHQTNDDDTRRYIQFLLSEKDTMVVGVGMLLSLNPTQRANILDTLLDTQSSVIGDFDDLQDRSFFCIAGGHVGKGTLESTGDVTYFMLRPKADEGGYMTKEKTIWQGAILDKLRTAFPYSMPSEVRTALCGEHTPNHHVNMEPFLPNSTRRLYPPVNPAKPRPVVTAAVTTGAATAPGAVGPVIQQPGRSLANGGMRYTSAFRTWSSAIWNWGWFNSAEIDGGPAAIDTGRLSRRVNNDTLFVGQEGLYKISDTREALMHIVKVIEQDGTHTYVIQHKDDKGHSVTTNDVRRSSIRLIGYGYETVRGDPTLLRHCRETFRFDRDGILAGAIIPPDNDQLQVHKLRNAMDDTVKAALTQSYGIEGFYLISMISDNQYKFHTSKQVTTTTSHSPIPWYVVVPPPGLVEDWYLLGSIRSTDAQSQPVKFGLGIDDREYLLVDSNYVFDKVPHTITKYRKPGQLYPVTL